MSRRICLLAALILVFTMIFSLAAFADPETGETPSDPPEQTEQTTGETPAETPAETPSETPQEPTQQQPPAQQPAQPRSNDSTLKSLSIVGKTEDGSDYPVEIDFKPSTRTYDITVPFEVVRLEIKAAANHRAARVTIPAGYLKLDVGQNRSFVNVTAEDGSTRRYQINTLRNEETTTETTTEEPTSETTTEVPTTQEITVEVVATTQGDIQKPPMNTYTKLGIVFACCGVLLFIISVAILSKKKDTDTED